MRMKIFKCDESVSKDFFMCINEEYSEKTLKNARERALKTSLDDGSYCLSIFNCRKILIVYEYGKIIDGKIVPEKTILDHSPMNIQNELYKKHKER